MVFIAAVLVLFGYSLEESIKFTLNFGFWFYVVVWPLVLLLGVVARYKPLIFQSVSALVFAPFYIPALMAVYETPTDIKLVASLIVMGGIISLFVQFPTLFKIR